MAADALRALLSQRGLWVAPIENWLAETGLETPDDLRCCFGNAQQAEDRGGPLLRQAWEVASGLGPTDATMAVVEARRSLAPETLRRRALHARPDLPVEAREATRHTARCP